MVDEPSLDSSRARFSKEQKIGLGLLLVFSVMSIGLGALQIRNRLYKPFALNSNVPGGLKEEINTIEALRYRDTDFDELNDFDETYVHGTSVYLADSDSDGLSDKSEVMQGTNPLCAKNKDCEAEELSASEFTGQIASSSYGVDEQYLPADITKSLQDPAYIRKLLAQNGLSKQLLDTMSDKQIIAMVNQVLQTTVTTTLPR